MQSILPVNSTAKCLTEFVKQSVEARREIVFSLFLLILQNNKNLKSYATWSGLGQLACIGWMSKIFV